MVPTGPGPHSVAAGHPGSYASSRGANSERLSEDESQDDESSSSYLVLLFDCRDLFP